MDIRKSLWIILAVLSLSIVVPNTLADTFYQKPPNYSLGTAQPVGNGHVLGQVSNGNTDYYTFNGKAGDNLALSAISLNPSLSLTELLLFAPDGLVAGAFGNGSDGFSSFINYNAYATGTWLVGVSAGRGRISTFSYDLTIQGATGARIATPEPATGGLVLAGVGLLGLVIVRRKRIPVGQQIAQ